MAMKRKECDDVTIITIRGQRVERARFANTFAPESYAPESCA